MAENRWNVKTCDRADEQVTLCPGVVQDEYTPTELSALASRNEMPDKPMACIDWLLWYMLRDIYSEFAAGMLTKEQGAERKQHAVRIYEREWERIAQNNALCDRVVNLWKGLEEASSAYRKDRTLENADNLMRVVYGFM